GRPVRVDAQVLWVDRDSILVRFIELGHHLDERKRRVAPVVLVERRDAHQSMHAVLRPQKAVRARAADDEGRALEPGLLSWRRLEDLALKALALSPLQVHA